MKTFLLAMLLLAQRPAPTPVQTGSISGRLLNTDGAPAVRIRVSAMPAPDSPVKPMDGSTLMTLAETDSDGRFRLADIPVGRYFVVAGSLDSPTYYPRGTVPASATAINITAGARIADINFRIEGASSSFSVSGRVTYESTAGRSILGSQVRLNGGPVNASYSDLSATPGPDGLFEIQHVRPGAYTLGVYPAPFLKPVSVVVTEKDVKGIEVVVPWTTEVTGQVAVEDNAGPVPNVSLIFGGAGLQTSAYQFNQGHRATLAEGFYVVTVNGLPSGFFVKSIAADSTDLLSKPFRVAKDQTIPTVAVTLGVSTPSPWVKISGHLMPPDSKANSLTFSGSPGSYEARISADGSFEIPKILPGTYNASLRSSVSTPSPYQQSLSVVVPPRDVSGIELTVPAVREISGRVVLEGGGPVLRPALTVMGTPEQAPSLAPGSAPSLGQLLVTPQARPPQISMFVNMQLDGSFKTALPDGQYRLAASLPTNNGAVSPYIVKELRYGNTDLLTDPFLVTGEAKELLIKLAPALPMASVKVSGRVLGLPQPSNTAAVTATVTLTNPLFITNPIASVAADGSFEFPKVYPGSYTARVTVPALYSNVIPTVDVTVADRDVTNLQFVAPRLREISGRIIKEGNGPLPGFSVLFSSVAGGNGGIQQYLTLNPQPDGSFKLSIAEGNWFIGRQTGLPSGYNIKDITYGSSSVLNSAMKVNADISELRVSITTPNATPVKVRGKVTNVEGIPAENPPAAVVMNAQGYAGSLEASIAPDGSFEFPEVFPGTYTARLSLFLGNLRTMNTTVNVASRDVSDVAIVVPKVTEIAGKVILEGRGVMPRLNIPISYSPSGPSGISSMASILNITPAADGTFKAAVTMVDWRMSTANGLPNGYTLKSITSGTRDLLASPIDFSSDAISDVRIVIKTPDVGTVKVSGKVTNLDAITIATIPPIAVVLDAPGIATQLQSAISPDGSFEFPEVFPGNYTAHLSRILPDVGTPSTPVNTGATGVSDVKIVIPRTVEINGRVQLEGRGAMPRITLIYLNDLTVSGTTRSSLPGTFVINPSADGSFKIRVPGVNRRVGNVIGLPPDYVLKLMTLGSTDIFKSPMTLDNGAIPELRIVIATPDKAPVKVSGKVIGIEASQVRVQPSVQLNSTNYAAPIETSVAADGSFEFGEVFPGTYSTIVLGVPTLAPSSSAPVVVGGSDIKDLIVRVQSPVEIRGRVTLEGSGPLPRLTFGSQSGVPVQATALAIPLSSMVISIITLPDGTFRLQLPEGERSPLSMPTNMPSGYSLKSVYYGNTNVLRSPLKISRSDPQELVIVVAASNPKSVTVSGQVDGLDVVELAKGTVRMVLESPSYSIYPNAILRTDGTFEIASVYPGTYIARVLVRAAGILGFVVVDTALTNGGGAPAELQSRTTVVVADKDVTDVHVSALAR